MHLLASAGAILRRWDLTLSAQDGTHGCLCMTLLLWTLGLSSTVLQHTYCCLKGVLHLCCAALIVQIIADYCALWLELAMALSAQYGKVSMWPNTIC